MGQPCSVMLIDVDHFKQINDQRGHIAGDDALRQVAAVIEQSVRRSDVAARFGGEEFMVVSARTGVQEAHAIADRIRQGVQELGGDPPLTVSIGLGQSIGKLESIARAIERADEALYRAKQLGRNRVEHNTSLPQSAA